MLAPHALRGDVASSPLPRHWRCVVCFSSTANRTVCHCWLVQQWAPGTRFALLGKPAVARNPSCATPRGGGFVVAFVVVSLVSLFSFYATLRGRTCRGLVGVVRFAGVRGCG